MPPLRDGGTSGLATTSTTTTVPDPVEDGLRGPPQMLPLLQLLGERATQVFSSAATAGECEERDGESGDGGALVFLCDALVNGGGGGGPGSDSGTASSTDSSSTGEATERALKQQVKLSFPLAFLAPSPPSASPSLGPVRSTMDGTAQRARMKELCADGRVVRLLLIPLFDRWRRGEHKRLLDSQSTTSKQAFFKVDEDSRREAKESMTLLLDVLLSELVERRDGAEDGLGEVCGRLAEATGSFRALCVGAVLLFYAHLDTLARVVEGEGHEAGTERSTPTTTDALRVAATAHATALMTEWVQYFARHGGDALYDMDLQAQLRAAEREIEVATRAARTARPRNGADSSPWIEMSTTMDEVQWSFVMSLVLCVCEDLRARAALASAHPHPSAAASQVLASKHDVLLRFVTLVQASLLRFASVHLSLTLAQRFSHLTSTMAARNFAATRDILWGCVALSGAASHGNTESADNVDKTGEVGADEQGTSALTRRDGSPDWGAVLQLLARLTATQLPSEETTASSVISAGDKGYGLGSSGFYLGGGSSSGVLGAMARRVSSGEAAVLDAVPASTAVPVLAGHKRARDGDSLTVAAAQGTPKQRLLHYLTLVFYTIYHPSCFTILQSESDWLRARSLRGLHALLHPPPAQGEEKQPDTDTVTEEGDSLRGWSSSSSSDDGDGAERSHQGSAHADGNGGMAAMVSPPPAPTAPAQAVHQRLLDLLRSEPRLPLMLVHGMLTQLERRGKVGTEEGAALTAWLIPCLVALGSAATTGEEEAVAGADADGVVVWTTTQRTLFCLLTLVSSGLLLALPWSVAGIYLCLRRYTELARQMREEHLHSRDGAAACLDELQEWVKDGAGAVLRPPGKRCSLVCNAIDDVVEATDPFYQQLNSTAAGSGRVAGDALLEERLRMVTPLSLPSPCGLVVVVAAARMLSRQLYALRNAFEEQRALAEEAGGGYEYLNRSDTFCTTDDIRAFRVAVHTTHRMVFGFQPQPPGLLKLWIGYLRHLFVSLVPPPADDDAVRLMPASWQQQCTMDCFGREVPRRGWRAAVKTPGTRYSSQTELRAALGAALADLALLPLADPRALLECPTAFPLTPHSAEWQAHRQHSARSQRCVDAALPPQVLETICFFLSIETDAPVPLSRAERAGSPTSPHADREGDAHGFSGDIDEDAFLGLQGMVALCLQLDRRLVPGSVVSPRVAHLIRCLWAAADTAAVGR